MLVYRYQNDQGRGPYNSDWPLKQEIILCHGSDIRNHPDPLDDFNVRAPGLDYIYGCPSMETLHNWFMGWVKDLQDHGFMIVEVQVPEEQVMVGKSGKQVAFPALGNTYQITIIQGKHK